MKKGQSRVFKNIFERGYLFYLGFLFQKMISVLCYFSKWVVKIIGINTGRNSKTLARDQRKQNPAGPPSPRGALI